MHRRRVLWLLYPTYLFIMLVSLVAVAWYASRSIRQFYLEQIARDLTAQATLVSAKIGTLSSDTSKLQATVRDLSIKSGARITVISHTGNVLADSEEDPSLLDNQSTQPEILVARTSQSGVAIRHSNYTGENVMYVAISNLGSGSTPVFVRVALPIGFVDASLRSIRTKIAIGALVIALLSAAVALWVSRRISKPIQQLRKGAERYASGDFSSRVPVGDSEEIGGLAEAMNQMALQLDDRIRTITLQRNEQDAILSSMVEGVIAVDTEQRLIIINRAAARLMNIDPEIARGRLVHEVLRNTDFLFLISTSLASRREVQGEIVLAERGNLHLQAHGTLLKDQTDKSLGVLLVFHDITKLRRLEQIRREFVANVSHELKTPITSIKGFVETLQEGAVQNPDDATRFLGIISRHVDRLNSIIEDLLALSRIEQEAENSEIPLETGSLCEILHSAAQTCSLKAAEKNIEIRLSCESALQTRVNAPLLEQAIVNLIDNAIRYSGVTTPISVTAAKTGNEIVISIHDDGCGIDKSHLSRLWERFYRVDKARSRSLGGTGLGLAIVKHIVLAHGGRVSVESTVGKGSTFNIHLPV